MTVWFKGSQEKLIFISQLNLAEHPRKLLLALESEGKLTRG